MNKFVCLAFSLLISCSFALPQPQIDSILFNQAYDRGKNYFYKALKKYAPEYKLDPNDKEAILEARKKYPELYSHLMNFYFYTASDVKLVKGNIPSFMLSHSINMAKELLQSVSLKYLQKDPSPLKSVLTSSGFYSRKYVPQFRGFLRPMSRYLKSQWALDEVKIKEAHSVSKGKGINIAVIDSGVDPTIVEIKARISKWKNFIDGSIPINDKGQFPFDWGGHGNAIACVLYQSAPKAEMIIVKVVDNERMHTVPSTRWALYLISAGIKWAALNGADIISISIGLEIDFQQIREASKFCWENNIILVTSMGNAKNEKDKHILYYPAAYPWTIAVGGVEKKEETLRVWNSSSYGYYIDVVAPSSEILVEPPSYFKTKGKPVKLFGNSLAVPIVSGTAALILSSMGEKTIKKLKKEPGRLVETVRKIIRDSSSNEKLGFDKSNPISGYGLINVAKAVHMAKNLNKSVINF